MESFDIKLEQSLSAKDMIPINIKGKEFDILMSIYQKALEQVYNELNLIKNGLSELYGYELVNHIAKRIKSPNSIVNKMKKKNYEINYKNLVEKIDDIAGIRVICPIKSNIYTMVNVISQMPSIKVLKVKDYMSKPKKSGYSGYHIVIETPVEIEKEKIFVKVEIQLRTMAMDFWATNEHKMRYKTNHKLSKLDSKKLTIYAKLLNFIDDKIEKICQKQELV